MIKLKNIRDNLYIITPHSIYKLEDRALFARLRIVCTEDGLPNWASIANVRIENDLLYFDFIVQKYIEYPPGVYSYDCLFETVSQEEFIASIL